MSGQDKVAGDVLGTAQSVLEAGRLVQTFLARGDDASVAVDQLEAAAADHEGSGAADLALRFAEPGAERGADDTAQADVLISVTADLDVATVLLAAAQASGDGVGARGDPILLQQALLGLEETNRSIGAGLDVATFYFGEPAAAASEPPSSSLAAASDRLRQRSTAVLATLSRRSDDVISSCASALKDMVPEQVKTALQTLGQGILAIPGVGRLVRWGLRILHRALDSLWRLLHFGGSEPITAPIGEVWEAAQNGTLLQPVLGRVFGDAQGVALLDDVIARATDIGRLDAASAQLSGLIGGFDTAADTLKAQVTRISKLIPLALLAAGLFPALHPWVAATGAAGYVIVIGVVLTLGMDYADRGPDRWQVVGFQQILRGAAA